MPGPRSGWSESPNSTASVSGWSTSSLSFAPGKLGASPCQESADRWCLWVACRLPRLFANRDRCSCFRDSMQSMLALCWLWLWVRPPTLPLCPWHLSCQSVSRLVWPPHLLPSSLFLELVPCWSLLGCLRLCLYGLQLNLTFLRF